MNGPSDKAELELRLSFLAIGEADRRALADLRPTLERHADSLVASFYRHLLGFAPTRALLAKPDVKERLLVKQREYLLGLSAPALDLEYFEERKRIGQTHERVGLSPAWYLGAYSLYFSLLAPLVGDSHRGDPERGERTLVALMKVLMLDAQLAMEAYIERHERDLEYMNRELAAAGRDLARDYEEQQQELRQTARRARAAEELASVATLVAGLAHEIGTPMSVIQGHAELLESSVDDERSRWRLRTIRDQIDRISRIIQALLNIARPRTPVRRPVDLTAVIDGTLSFLGERFRRHDVEVERRFEPVPDVMGDGEKLQQLFLNLFINAVDAMKPQKGPRRLTVTLAVEEPGQVVARVRDTGTGIPPEGLERIFDPFFTTKPAGEGSGLGLVVARGIVRDHDGELDVESTPDRGTEFRVRIPVPESDQPTAKSGA